MKTPLSSFCRLASYVLTCLAGLLSVAQAHAEGGWRDCAAEGQICSVRGPSTVRFGADGEYRYRNVDGPVPCNNSVFGDPIRGEHKRCAYRFGHNQSPDDRHPGDWNNNNWSGNNAWNERGWEFCAREGRICNFRGTREVRFGAAGRYAVRTVTGGTECSVRVFGDPNPRIQKTCEVRDGSNWGGGYNRPPISTDSRDWRFCSNENETCRPPRGAIVRFGTSGRYAYQSGVMGRINCNVSNFGDPFRGAPKVCEFRVR